MERREGEKREKTGNNNDDIVVCIVSWLATSTHYHCKGTQKSWGKICQYAMKRERVGERVEGTGL